MTKDTIRVACHVCSTHGETWNEECQAMKVCAECLGSGWLLDDRVHIPSPRPNPDEPNMGTNVPKEGTP